MGLCTRIPMRGSYRARHKTKLPTSDFALKLKSGHGILRMINQLIQKATFCGKGNEANHMFIFVSFSNSCDVPAGCVRKFEERKQKKN